MRRGFDKYFHRLAILNRLSPKEREESEKNWERRNKKEYDKFKEWEREYLEWEQYWEIGEELFKLEDKAYSLYCQNRLQGSFNCYKEILKLKHHTSKKVWVKNFNWYDKVLEICFIKFEDDLNEFFKNLYMVTPENYKLCFDKARKLFNFHCTEQAVELGYKLYEVNPNDLDLIIFMKSAMFDLKCYDESLRFCEEGLILDNDNKNLSLSKLDILVESDRLDDAMEHFKNLLEDYKYVDTAKLQGKLKEHDRYDDILELRNAKFNRNPKSIDFIDSIKDIIDEGNLNVEPIYPKELYMDWIYAIKDKNNHEICPICGSKLDLVEDKFSEDFERVKKKHSLSMNPDPYCGYGSLCDIYLQCKNCKEIIYLDCLGLNIEFNGNILLKKYVQDKICELRFCEHFATSQGDMPLKDVKSEMRGLDDKEFDAFIAHLKNLNFICEPRKGYIKFIDEDLFRKVFSHWYD